MFAIALALLPLVQAAQQPPPPKWVLGGTNRGGYAMEASGSPTTAAGAILKLTSTTATSKGYGAVSSSVPADTLAGRRVRFSAEIETHDVSGSAALWLRADSGSRMLAIDNGFDQAMKGTAGPRRMTVTVYVPRYATNLEFGLLISGTGSATARGVRMAASPVAATDAPLPAAVERELDSAIAIARHASLWRDTVTWDRVLPDVRRGATGAEVVTDVYPAIRYLLSRLGDHHSLLMRPQATRAFQTGGAANSRPIVRVEQAGIGYVAVPGFMGADVAAIAAYARDVHDSLSAAMAGGAGSCRWIVDLRADGGGNMWPMLAGLRPFLGDTGLGSFVTADGSGPMWHAGQVGEPAQSAPLARLESAYVAVLTGPRTASSGEAVTIAFRGRPRTRSFGLPTAGLSTSNQGYPLPDGAMIFVTTAVEADRAGARYGHAIAPDELVPADLPGAANDLELARAAAWLRAQPCGGTPLGSSKPRSP